MNRPKSHVELLAEQRDYKRRRQKYRAKNVHITKRTPVQVIFSIHHFIVHPFHRPPISSSTQFIIHTFHQPFHDSSISSSIHFIHSVYCADCPRFDQFKDGGYFGCCGGATCVCLPSSSSFHPHLFHACISITPASLSPCISITPHLYHPRIYLFHPHISFTLTSLSPSHLFHPRLFHPRISFTVAFTLLFFALTLTFLQRRSSRK
jgi:hypothetical protein